MVSQTKPSCVASREVRVHASRPDRAHHARNSRDARGRLRRNNSGSGGSGSGGGSATTAAPSGTRGGRAYGGYGGGPTSSAAGTTTGGIAVTTDNFAFLPTALQVKVGQEVTWTTQQDVAHTVTADEGAFAHSMPAGARFALPSPSGQLRLPLHRSPGDARDDRGFVAVRP